MKKLFTICCLFALGALGESGVRNPVTRASLGAVSQDNGTATNLTVFNGLVFTNSQPELNPMISLPLYSGGDSWLSDGGLYICPNISGLTLNTSFSFCLNSDFLSENGGWNSVTMQIGGTNYCSFLIGYEGNQYLPEEPVFAFFNDVAYREFSEQSSPFAVGLLSKVFKINYTFIIDPAVIPTARTNAQVGGIYVDGTNEVLRIRLTE
jgi:hypothetical protein